MLKTKDVTRASNSRALRALKVRSASENLSARARLTDVPNFELRVSDSITNIFQKITITKGSSILGFKRRRTAAVKDAKRQKLQ